MRWTRRALEELALLEQAGAEDEWSYLEGQQDRPSLLSREAASWSRLTIMLVLMAAAVWLIPIAFAFALEF